MATADTREAERLRVAWKNHHARVAACGVGLRRAIGRSRPRRSRKPSREAARRGEAIEDVARWVWRATFRIAAGLLTPCLPRDRRRPRQYAPGRHLRGRPTRSSRCSTRSIGCPSDDSPVWCSRTSAGGDATRSPRLPTQLRARCGSASTAPVAGSPCTGGTRSVTASPRPLKHCRPSSPRRLGRRRRAHRWRRTGRQAHGVPAAESPARPSRSCWPRPRSSRSWSISRPATPTAHRVSTDGGPGPAPTSPTPTTLPATTFEPIALGDTAWTGSQYLVWGGEGSSLDERERAGRRLGVRPGDRREHRHPDRADRPAQRGGRSMDRRELIVCCGLRVADDPEYDTGTAAALPARHRLWRRLADPPGVQRAGSERRFGPGRDARRVRRPERPGSAGDGRIRPCAPTAAPSRRSSWLASAPQAAWNGREIIVWSPAYQENSALDRGYRYDPSADVWTALLGSRRASTTLAAWCGPATRSSSTGRAAVDDSAAGAACDSATTTGHRCPIRDSGRSIGAKARPGASRRVGWTITSIGRVAGAR